jgi:hypothetical protein
MGELVRARNLFFIPFYGAFLAFIMTQSAYIINANPLVQLLIAITFLGGVYYANIVSKYLWSLEMLRFLYGVQSKYKSLDEKAIEAVSVLSATTQSLMYWEGKVLKWEMYLLWITTGSVLIDIYFGHFLRNVTVRALSELLRHI